MATVLGLADCEGAAPDFDANVNSRVGNRAIMHCCMPQLRRVDRRSLLSGPFRSRLYASLYHYDRPVVPSHRATDPRLYMVFHEWHLDHGSFCHILWPWPYQVRHLKPVANVSSYPDPYAWILY